MNRRIFVPIALALLASGCATAPVQPKLTAAALPGKDSCVYSINVTSWEVLDDQTLLVQAQLSRDTYLFKLFAPITGLSFHEALGFEDGDHNGQLCSTGDSIVVRGPVPQSSPIAAVRLLTPEEVKQLKAAGKKS